MNRHTRNDSASINISFNLPPVVIREFFEGWAKVESAKHIPASKSGLDLGSLFSAVAPLLLPMLIGKFTEKSSDSSRSSGVRVPEPRCEPRNVSRSEQNSSDETPAVVISFVQKPAEESTKHESVKHESVKHESTKHESVKVESEKSKESEKSEKCKESEKSKESEESEKSKEVSSSVKEVESMESAKKSKKPMYSEDEGTVHFDLGDLANGGGGFGDMMKMFAPMMKGLMGGLNGMNEKTGEISKESMETKVSEGKQEVKVSEGKQEVKVSEGKQEVKSGDMATVMHSLLSGSSKTSEKSGDDVLVAA